MIQINLIPDVKAKYIKVQQKKRMVILSSVTISCVALGLVFLLGTYVYAGQKIRLNNLEESINKNSQELKKIEGLDKILTVQNQLNDLTGLHQDKPVVSRVFTLLPQITPNDMQISDMNVDFQAVTIKFSGTAKNFEVVNKFVDTLKFTDFATESGGDKQRAFSDVVLSSHGVGNSQGGESSVSYTVDMIFKPEIFDSQNKSITFVVPKITSTRSQTEKPEALFNTTSEADN